MSVLSKSKLSFTVMLLILMAPLTIGAGSPEDEDKAVTTVVIDPGHGGHDSGCLGDDSQEKHIVLDIGLKLGEYIKENYPDVDVHYTRKTDKFIPLHKRSSIANKNNADVFISLHANATKTASVKGTETYVMGLHRTKQNLKVAKRENSVVTMEEDYKEHYDGFDPDSPQGHIIFSLQQNAHLEQSINLASKIEHQFKHRAKRKSRGVKQAGFLVLYKTTMPSVLIESGFLTNDHDEQYLMSEKGQTYTASAIYRAFRDYKEEMDKKVLAGNAEDNQSSTSKERKNRATASTETNMTHSSPAKKDSKKKKDEKASNKGIKFSVQVMASKEKLDKDSKKFKKIDNLWIDETENGTFKYLAGNHKNYNKAIDHQEKIRKKGFKGAWVVSYQNGKRIPIKKAVARLKEQNE